MVLEVFYFVYILNIILRRSKSYGESLMSSFLMIVMFSKTIYRHAASNYWWRLLRYNECVSCIQNLYFFPYSVLDLFFRGFSSS